jgi:chaperonin GroEL
MAKSQTRRAVFQPTTYRRVQKGIDQMVNAIRPTLGPLPRIVALERVHGNSRMPELLDDGGMIARRILQLPNHDEDMGAMFIRHLLWRMHEEVGDGTATAAVLFQSIYDQGVRYIVAGGNAMRLRHYLENGMRVILDELSGMAVHLEGKKRLAQIAESICYDPPLAKMMGEVFDIIGEYGRLEIRAGRSREIEREYVEGMYWGSGLTSRQMITDHTKLRTEMENVAILISDLRIEDQRQLLSTIEKLVRAEIRSLLVIASRFSESVTAALLAASRDPAKFQVIAVRTPGASDDQIAAMEDLAILTGGHPLAKAAGQTLDSVRSQDLGRARQVWADRSYFGIMGGKGDPRALRQHIAELRRAFKRASAPDTRTKLRKRIGKLMGGSATLWVGGTTELEINARKALAERTSDALRGAIMEGVIPGGGVSLLACRPTLQKMLDQSTDSDERTAYRILIKALETPIRTILANAGRDASEIMAEIKLAGANRGFDVRSGQITDMAEAGIYDAANVQRAAVRSAVAGAALALTVDVLIHSKKPQESLQTG